MAGRARPPKPQQHEDTTDQIVSRAFRAAVADIAHLVTSAHDSDRTSDLVTGLRQRHRHLALDPELARTLGSATARIFTALLTRIDRGL
jgi:hypothetical protein